MDFEQAFYDSLQLKDKFLRLIVIGIKVHGAISARPQVLKKRSSVAPILEDKAAARNQAIVARISNAGKELKHTPELQQRCVVIGWV
jgi:hypothetical protein